MDALLVHVAQDRHDQAALGIDGHADVVVLLEDSCPPATSRLALNCGNCLRSDGARLEDERRHRQLRALALLLLAERLQVGDVGQVVLRDVRDRAPGDRPAARRSSCGSTRTASCSTGPHLREIGQRRGGRSAVRRRRRRRRRCGRKSLTSSWVTRPVGPLPGTWPRSTPQSRASRRVAGPAGTTAPSPAGAAGCGGRAGCGAGGLTASTGGSDFSSAVAFTSFGMTGGSALGTSGVCGWVVTFAVGGVTWPLPSTTTIAWPGRDLVAFLDQDFRDLAGHGRRDGDGALLGLDLDQLLPLA